MSNCWEARGRHWARAARDTTARKVQKTHHCFFLLCHARQQSFQIMVKVKVKSSHERHGTKSRGVDDPNRPNSTNGNSNVRTRSTVNRLLMYRKKAPSKGKSLLCGWCCLKKNIFLASIAKQYHTVTPRARIQPDKRWFGVFCVSHPAFSWLQKTKNRKHPRYWTGRSSKI